MAIAAEIVIDLKARNGQMNNALRESSTEITKFAHEGLRMARRFVFAEVAAKAMETATEMIKGFRDMSNGSKDTVEAIDEMGNKLPWVFGECYKSARNLFTLLLTGKTIDEIKEHNREIAKSYLEINTIIKDVIKWQREIDHAFLSPEAQEKAKATDEYNDKLKEQKKALEDLKKSKIKEAKEAFDHDENIGAAFSSDGSYEKKEWGKDQESEVIGQLLNSDEWRNGVNKIGALTAEYQKHIQAIDVKEQAKEQQQYIESLVKSGEDMTKEMRTPLEAYQDQLAKIKELQASGAIDAKTAARATAKANEEMFGGGHLQNASAVSRRMDFRILPSPKLADPAQQALNVAQQNLTEVKRTNALLVRIADGRDKPVSLGK